NMADLTPKQARFVAEYLKDLNATQAAIRAGYSAATAEQQGSRLLRNAQVFAAVADGKAKQLAKADLSATRVLEEMRRVAFSNVQDLFDANGRLKGIHELTTEQAATIASLEVIVKNAEAGDGHQDVVHKLKVWDKPRVLEMLGKHFGLLVERLEHQGELRISWEE
ncbi:MAG TPA: terminase small subunit, partial [Phycisphaerales bacterium]|nr:terminase small subunit [Phycisphaerales bacterium]